MRGLAFLESREQDPQPWFLWMHYFDPHCAYVEQDEVFGGAGAYEGPVCERPALRRALKQRRSLTSADHAELRRLYDSRSTTRTRSWAVLARLEETGALDDTIVVVTPTTARSSWTTAASGTRARFHEELILVPLLVRIPGESPRRIDDPVAFVDLFPTLAAQLGVEAPAGAVGLDIRPGGSGLEPRAHRLLETNRVDAASSSHSRPAEGDPGGPDAAPQVFDLDSDQAEHVGARRQLARRAGTPAGPRRLVAGAQERGARSRPWTSERPTSSSSSSWVTAGRSGPSTGGGTPTNEGRTQRTRPALERTGRARSSAVGTAQPISQRSPA